MGCYALLQGIFPTQGSNQVSCVSCVAGGFFITSATREALSSLTRDQTQAPLQVEALSPEHRTMRKVPLFFYLFLAVLGLCCCTGASSSYGVRVGH